MRGTGLYLNAGTGAPWAGHRSAVGEPSVFLKEKESIWLENFGLALPMGSKEWGEIITSLPVLPKSWDGRPLSRAKEADWLVHQRLVGKKVHSGGELRRGAADGLFSRNSNKQA